MQASYSLLKQSADKVSENKHKNKIDQLSTIVDEHDDEEEEKVDIDDSLKQDNIMMPSATTISSAGFSLKSIADLKSKQSEAVKPSQQAALTTASKAFGMKAPPTVKTTNRLSVLGRKVAAMQKVASRVVPVNQSADDAILTDLKSHILVQRKLLDPAFTDDFDEAWGLDRFGEFDRSVVVSSKLSRLLCMNSEGKSVQDEIVAAIKYARLSSTDNIETLKYATPTARGLAVLHTFILDLLGHHTPAAYIFRKKIDEDFVKLPVTSRSKKWMSLGIVVAINAFMIVYTLMYGLKRGLQWQISLLYGCIFQLIVEVIFNETLECVWINYVVPTVVIPDIRKAYDVICECIDQVCYQKMSTEAHYLDTTKYFFISRKVADAYPNLPESIIIQNYHSYLPGLIAKKWQKSYHQHHHQHQLTVYERCKQSQLRLVEYGAKLLVTLGSCPFIVQRIIVRVLQPLLFQAMVVYFDYIKHSTALYVVSLLLFSVIVARILYSYLAHYMESKKINPLQSLSLFRRSKVKRGNDNFDIESPKRLSRVANGPNMPDGGSCASSDSHDSISTVDSVDKYPLNEIVITRNVPPTHKGVVGYKPSLKDALSTSMNSNKDSSTNKSSSEDSVLSKSRSASDHDRSRSVSNDDKGSLTSRSHSASDDDRRSYISRGRSASDDDRGSFVSRSRSASDDGRRSYTSRSRSASVDDDRRSYVSRSRSASVDDDRGSFIARSRDASDDEN